MPKQPSWKSAFVSSVIFTSGLLLGVVTFVIANNPDDAKLPFGSVIFFSAIFFGFVFASIWILSRFSRGYVDVPAIFSGIGIAAAFKFYFFPSKVPLLDGTEEFYSFFDWGSIVSLATLVVIIAVAIWIALKARSILAFVATALLIMALQPLLGAPFGSLIPDWRKETASFTHFSEVGDTLVLVLDTIQGDVALEVLEERPDLRETWRGFDYFWNNVGMAPTTLMSMLAVYSGSQYREGSVSATYASLSDDSIFSDFRANGFDTNLLGASFFSCPATECLHPSVLGARSPLEDDLSSLIQIWEIGLLRILPLGLHEWWYNNGEGRVPLRPSGFPSGTLPRSVATLRALAADAEAFDIEPMLKVVHVMGAHPPITMNSDCEEVEKRAPTREAYKDLVECNIQLATNLLRSLQQIGVYDNMTIVVMADHGETVQSPKSGSDTVFDKVPKLDGRKGRFSPMLTIKPKGATDEFRLNDAPTSSTDLRATLCRIALAKCEVDVGENVFDIKTSQRTREFIDFRLRQSDHRRLDGMPREAFVIYRTDRHLADEDFDFKLAPTITKLFGPQDD